MFIEVVKAEYLENYKLKLIFNDGVCKTVDLENELKGKVFEPLKDKSFFKDFKISFNTIEWKNGADIAPEYLYEIGK
jgi:hypothetical protein